MKKIFKRIGFFMAAVCMMLMFSMSVQAASTPNWNDNACYGTGNPLSASYKYQCTWYVWGRTREVLGIQLSGRTSQYVNSSVTGGYTTTPSTHSIAVYTNSSGKILHVAFIENYDGTNVSYSEGNAGSIGTGVQKYHAATFTLSDFTTKTIKWVGNGCTTVKYIPLVSGTTSNTTSSYYVAVKSTATGGLALNDKPASSSAGKSTELITIPIGAVCTVYPSKASGNWYYVTYKGVSGYAYGTYLTTVTKTVSNGIESTHPHRKYNQYSNGYKEILSSDTAIYTKTKTVQPTCTSAGYSIYTCDKCSATKTGDNVSATGHKAITDPAVAATCSTSGKTAGSHCATCGKVIVAQTTIAAKGHSWSKTKVVQPTCTSAGYSIYTCSGCGATKTGDNVSATGHKTVTDPAVAATCSTSGKTAGSHCATCGKVIVAQTTIEATGNHTKTTTVSKKATTTTNGKKTTKCSTCGKTLSTETIYNASIVKLSATSYTYNGKVKNPTVIIKDGEGNTISSDNYTLTKASGRKKVGKYTYKIKFKNQYSGTKTLTFKINPKATSLTSLSRSKKAFTVKWNKISAQASGYEIMYATNSSFTKNKKTVTVSSYKTTSKKITGLKANTKYYVKIRTYKTVDGVKYYSAWSKAKTVTTK